MCKSWEILRGTLGKSFENFLRKSISTFEKNLKSRFRKPLSKKNKPICAKRDTTDSFYHQSPRSFLNVPKVGIRLRVKVS